MPDTGIDDYEFRRNAELKARALGLDSFLWNVSHARLYIREPVSDLFVAGNEWSDLADITTRAGVVPNYQRWKNLAGEIFTYLNDLFDRGSLEGRQFIDAYRSGGITALIMENAGLVSDALIEAGRRDATLRAVDGAVVGQVPSRIRRRHDGNGLGTGRHFKLDRQTALRAYPAGARSAGTRRGQYRRGNDAGRSIGAISSAIGRSQFLDDFLEQPWPRRPPRSTVEPTEAV